MAKTLFEDGNIVTRAPGGRVLAAWLNKVFNHRHDGRDQDGSAPLDYTADTGAVNALVAAMPLPFDTLVVGLPFGIRVAHTNTGPVTVNVDGLGVYPLHKLGGLELGVGDIQETQIIRIAWDGTNFQLLSYNSPPVTDAATLQGQGSAMLAPPGMVADFAAPTVPPGWLLCDGRTVLRAQYPQLFAYVGTTWGAGDNVSTFGLPDFRGEFRRGWDNDRGVDAAREFGSFQDDQCNRLVQMRMATDNASASPVDVPENGDWSNYIQTGLGGTTIYTLSVRNNGAETRPRSIAVLPCIKY